MSNDWTSVDRCLGFVLVGSGLVQCFLGHRVIKLSVALSCFFGSFTVVQVASGPAELSRGAVLGVGLFVGLLAVWAVRRAYRMGVFCVGAVAGVLVGRFFAALLDISPTGFIGVCTPVVFGVLALFLEGAALALLTSVAGGGLVACGINAVRLGAFDLHRLSLFEIAAGLACSAFGFIKQKK